MFLEPLFLQQEAHKQIITIEHRKEIVKVHTENVGNPEGRFLTQHRESWNPSWRR